MNIAIIAGIVAFLLLVFIFLTSIIGGKDGTQEHFILRLLLIFFFLQFLIIIASDASNNCDFIENTTVTINTTATHAYNYQCVDHQTNTTKAFLRLVYAINYTFWIYVLLYVSYAFLIKRGIIKGKK
jgi:hypothetical protein